MPLITDDEESQQNQEQAQREPIDQLAQKTVQTGVSFKNLLAGFGGFLSRLRLPDSAKKGLKEFGQEIWYSPEDLHRLRGSRGRTKEKFTATPFRSFGPEKKKKGKL